MIDSSGHQLIKDNRKIHSPRVIMAKKTKRLLTKIKILIKYKIRMNAPE